MFLRKVLICYLSLLQISFCFASANASEPEETPVQKLHRAAQSDDVTLLEEALDEGAGIDESHEGSTALHKAIFSESESCFLKLLERGANVNAQAEVSGMTVLHLLILQEHFPFVRLILNDYDADPNLANTTGVTPLHFAAVQNDPEITHLLLTKGALATTLDGEGCTPLFCLVKNFLSGGDEAIEALNPNVLAHMQAHGEHDAEFDDLVAGVATDDELDNDPEAVPAGPGILLGDVEILPGGHGVGIHEDFVPAEDFFPEEEDDNNSEEEQEEASQGAIDETYDFLRNVHLLVSAGANANTVFEGTPLLHTVISYASLEDGPRHVRFLLAHGANPMQEDGEGRTAQQWATHEDCEALPSALAFTCWEQLQEEGNVRWVQNFSREPGLPRRSSVALKQLCLNIGSFLPGNLGMAHPYDLLRVEEQRAFLAQRVIRGALVRRRLKKQRSAAVTLQKFFRKHSS